MSEIVKVPNIGDFKNVEIIEVLVKEGDEINKGDPIITLESDKSSMEVPSNVSGKIINLKVKIGDKVSEGSLLAIIENGKAEPVQKENERLKEKLNGVSRSTENNENFPEILLNLHLYTTLQTTNFSRICGT